jgi:hypothetical protein
MHAFPCGGALFLRVNPECRQTLASFRLGKKIGNAGIMIARRHLDFLAVPFDIGNRLVDAVRIGVRLDFVWAAHAGSSGSTRSLVRQFKRTRTAIALYPRAWAVCLSLLQRH